MMALILYGLAVALLMIAGARAAEWLARGTGKPVRWVWLGAMLGTIVLSFAAMYRATRSGDVGTIVVVGASARQVPERMTQPTVVSRVASAILASRRALNDALLALLRATAVTQRDVSPGVRDAAIVVWALSGIVLLLIFGMVQRRMRRARRAWPLGEIAGARVRISPAIGPLVAGVVRPEIVVPRWLLDRASNDQRMVVAHEAEHVRAHDPALLGAACIALALMPWNPALWYMYSRLRLAVELDCDARVLRGGSAAAASYGALLIDVAERASFIRLSALALADDTSHLHQRILAMKRTRVRFAIARGGAALLIGSAALLAACAADIPTAADIQRMDASTAEASVKKLAFVKDTAIEYIVDGAPMAAEEARAIAPDDIDRVEISKNAVSGNGLIQMWTKHSAAALGQTIPEGKQRVNFMLRDKTMSDSVLITRPRTFFFQKQALATTEHDPAMFIDGVRVNPTALRTLDRSRIANIDVIKGPAAAKLYGPDAEGGAIVILTKKGANKD